MASPASPDPLSWPGALGARLALLILLAACATALTGGHVASVVVGEAVVHAELACLDALFAELTAGGDRVPATAIRERFVACAPAAWHTLMTRAPLLALAATAGLAVLIHVLQPTLIRRREGLHRAEAPVPGALAAWVDEEVVAARLAGRVRVHWQLHDPRPRARVFGRRGAYEVLLAGGLLGHSLTAPQRARAVLRHELAHIRHGDVDAFFATRALWWALLLGVVPALAATLPFLPRLETSTPLTVLAVLAPPVQILALLGVLLAARNLVLHEIEHRADLAAGGLDWRPAARRRPVLAGWMRAHPSDDDRRAVLDAPLRHLRLRRREAVLLGATLGLAVPLLVVTATIAIGVAVPRFGTDAMVPALTVPPTLATALVAAVLAQMVFRDRIAAAVSGQRRLGTLAIAGWLFAGVVVGLAATPVFGLATALGPTDIALPMSEAVSAATATERLLTVAVAALGLFAILAASAAWLRSLAGGWSVRLLRRPRPGALLAAGHVLGALALAPPLTTGLWLFVTGHLTALVGFPAEGLPPVVVPLAFAGMSVVVNPLFLATLVLLGTLPLAGAMAGRRPGMPIDARSRLLKPGDRIVLPAPMASLAALVVAAVLLVVVIAVIYRTPVLAKALVQALGDEPTAVGLAFNLVNGVGLAAIALLAAFVAGRLVWSHALAVCGLGAMAFAVAWRATFPDAPAWVALFGANMSGWLALILATPAIALVALVRRAPPTTVELVAVDRPAPATASGDAQSA